MRYDFNVSGEILSLKRGGILLGQWPVEAQADSDIKLRFSEDKIFIELADNDYLLGVIRSTDTVYVDSSEVTGTMSEKFTEVKGSVFTASEAPSGTATLQEDITYAALVVKINAGTLSKGQQYKITDRGDSGIIVKSITVNKVSRQGWGGFLNPDYQLSGVYSGVTGFTENKGIWQRNSGTLSYDGLEGAFQVGDYISGVNSGAGAEVTADDGATLTLAGINGVFEDNEQISGNTSEATANVNGIPTLYNHLTTGDVTIWNGKHFKKITTTPIPNTPSDGANYSELPKLTTNGYIEEWDSINYDFDNDFICGRRDNRGNVWDYSQAGYDEVGGDMEDFQWGNDDVFENVIKTGNLNCINNTGIIKLNVCEQEAGINATYNKGEIFYNTVGEAGSLQADYNEGNVGNNKIGGSSIIYVGLTPFAYNRGNVSNNTFLAGCNITAPVNVGVSFANCLVVSQTKTIDPELGASGKVHIDGLNTIDP